MSKNKTEDQEIAYQNESTGDIVEGFDPMFHALSEPASSMDETGAVKLIENFNGRRREVSVNLKGQVSLDHQRRGGKRLWQRIYTMEDLVERLEKQGMTVFPKKKEEKAKAKTKDSGSDDLVTPVTA